MAERGEIAVARTPADIAACMALRWQAFVVEQGVPEADELDGEDDACVHVLARVGGAAAGAARVRSRGEAVKIQRGCVEAARRGQGIGAALIRFCADQGRAQGAARAVLGAQVQALPFYEGLGFEAYGPVYDDAGIAHRDMALTL